MEAILYEAPHKIVCYTEVYLKLTEIHYLQLSVDRLQPFITSAEVLREKHFCRNLWLNITSEKL